MLRSTVSGPRLHCVDWIYGVFVCVRNLPVSQVSLLYLKRLGPMIVLEFA